MPGPPICLFTSRLLIRCWQPEDAPHLREAIEVSLDHLQPWLPWAASEPSDVATVRERIARFVRDFRSGADFVYGIFDRDRNEVLGGTGLHPRNQVDDLEIGYWLRKSATGRGLATESTRALTTAAFASFPNLRTVTIVCDPANVRSAAVPARLGYSCLGRVPAKSAVPGRTHDLVWQVTRAGWEEKPRHPAADR